MHGKGMGAKDGDLKAFVVPSLGNLIARFMGAI